MVCAIFSLKSRKVIIRQKYLGIVTAYPMGSFGFARRKRRAPLRMTGVDGGFLDMRRMTGGDGG